MLSAALWDTFFTKKAVYFYKESSYKRCYAQTETREVMKIGESEI